MLRNSRDLSDEFIEWEDIYDGHTKRIKFTRDTTLITRNADNAMSRLWEPTTKALKELGSWSDVKMERADGVTIRVWRLINKDRKLFVCHNGIPHCLFHAYKVTKDRTDVGYYPDTAKIFKLEAFAASVATPL